MIPPATHPVRRLAPALALAAVLALPGAAQQSTESASEDTASFTIPLGSSDGYVVLPISINGSKPLPILLDTGMPAPGIALFDGPHVEELDLDYLAMRAQVGGAGGGKSYEARISVGATFDIGGAKIENSRLIVMPHIPYFDIGLAGIIGYEALDAFAVSVDYDEKVITLTQPDAFEAPEGATAVPLEIKGNMPHVEVRLPRGDEQGESLRLVLDTGARHAVSLSLSHPAVSIPEGAVERHVGRGLSGALRGSIGRIEALQLGGHRLDSVVASFLDAEGDAAHGRGSDGNLGIGLLDRFNFALDYASKTLYLTPHKDHERPFEADMSGMTVESEDGVELRVAEVLAGSPAAEAGIAVGDRVLAIDGEALTGSDQMRFSDRLRKAGDIILEIESEGADARKVELTLRRMI